MLAAALCAAASPAGAKLHTLYFFCAQSGCADGREPSAGVEKLATFRVHTTRELEDRDIRETSVYKLG